MTAAPPKALQLLRHPTVLQTMVGSEIERGKWGGILNKVHLLGRLLNRVIVPAFAGASYLGGGEANQEEGEESGIYF